MATLRGGYAASLGFSVGKFDWLNSPNSKVNRYWRVIEDGSNATDWPWQGQRIVGLWGPNAGPRGNLIQGDLSGFQTGRGDQKFVPFFRERGKGLEGAARAALYYYLGGGRGPNMEHLNVRPRAEKGQGRGNSLESARQRMYFWLMMVGKPKGPRLDQLPFVQGIIMREVLAGNYYARAVASFDPLRREVEALRDWFGEDIINSGKGRRAVLELQAFDAHDRYLPHQGVPTKSAALPKGATAKARAAGARLQSERAGSFSTTVTTSVQARMLITNARGRFSQYQGDLARVNARLAEELQGEVAQLMRQERRRPVSGALIKATEDPRNRTPQ